MDIIRSTDCSVTIKFEARSGHRSYQVAKYAHKKREAKNLEDRDGKQEFFPAKGKTD